RSGIKTIFVADATLRHKIMEQENYEILLNQEKVLQVPRGTSADDYIWKMAKRYHKDGTHVSIVTNDWFPIDKGQDEKITGIDRMTFMFIDDMIIFQPSLEELLKPMIPKLSVSTEKKWAKPKTTNTVEAIVPKKPVQHGKPNLSVKIQSTVVPDELLMTLKDFVSDPNRHLRKKINFSLVSSYLHSKYGGNFCKHFGYTKPKDLASLLETQGYVVLSHEGKTLYVELTEKLTSAIK
ncbi:hypothetical protein B1A_13216, partial [mine drainage metagenome]